MVQREITKQRVSEKNPSLDSNTVIEKATLFSYAARETTRLPLQSQFLVKVLNVLNPAEAIAEYSKCPKRRASIGAKNEEQQKQIHSYAAEKRQVQLPEFTRIKAESKCV